MKALETWGTSRVRRYTLLVGCGVWLMALVQPLAAYDNPALGIAEPTIGLGGPNGPEGPCDPPCQDCTSSASPVIIKDGALFLTFTDLEYDVGELPFQLKRRYFSREWYVGKFGRGWTSPLDLMATSTVTGDAGNEVVVLHFLSGHRGEYVRQPDGSYGGPLGRTGTLTKITGGYRLRMADGILYFYDERVRLLRLEDRNGNDISFSYPGNSRRPNTITLFNNRVITLQYGANGLVESITDFAGRTVRYEYDNNFRLTASIDPLDGETTYTYTNGRLTQVTNPLGQVVFSVTYDGSGRVSRTISDEGDYTYTYSTGNTFKQDNSLPGTVGTRFYYDSLGVVTRVLNAAGNNSYRTYNAQYFLISNTDAGGHTATYQRDDRGNITLLTDAEGRQISATYLPDLNQQTQVVNGDGTIDKFEYDARGNLTRRTWAFGTPQQAEESFEYDARGNRTRWIDARGNTTLYGYNANNYLTSRTDREGRIWTSTYDSRGNVLSTANPLGHTYAYTYDALNRLLTTTDPENGVVTYAYDAAGRRTSATDRNSHTTQFAYDAYGRVTRITNAAQGVATLTYDPLGKVVSMVDPRGKYTYWLYDNLHRVTQLVWKIGDTAPTPDANDLVTTYAYDAAGNLTQEARYDGNTLTRAYDRTNLLTTRTAAYTGGSETCSWTYNNRALVATATDTRGRVITFGRDPIGRLTGVSDNLGAVATYQYDANGDQTAVVDAAGVPTHFIYDDENRLLTTTDALGHTLTLVRDDAGRIMEMRDALNQSVAFTRDGAARILSRSTAGETTYNEYDLEGDLTRVVDGRGNATVTVFDELNRPIETQYADSKSNAFAYDAFGNLTSVTRRDGTTIAYEYDDFNRVTRIDYPGTNDTLLTFGNDGRVASISNSHSTSTYTYTRGGRGMTVNQDGRTYSLVRNRTTGAADLTYASGLAVQELTDQRTRLTAVKIGGTDTATFGYNALDLVTTRTYANGVASTFAYNTGGDLTELGHTLSGADLWRRTLAYRDTGEIIRSIDQVTSDQSYNVDYDAVGRLTSFLRGVALPDGTIPAPLSTMAYLYDAAGNMTSRTIDATPQARTYDPVNALVTDGAQALAYDDRGNLTNDGTLEYEYDYDDNLTGVRRLSDSAVLLSAQYDGLGRRVRTVGPDGSVTRHYYLDTDVIEETDDTGTLQRSFVVGHGFPQPLVMVLPGATTRYYYLNDALGSVVALADNAGAIVERYLYGPFGTTTVTDGTGTPLPDSAVGNPWRWTGQRWDGYGGYHMVHRAYLPFFERFAQFDPLGYVTGPNLYAYGLNDPINYLDPFGLEWWNWKTRAWGLVKTIGGAAEGVAGGLGIAAGVAAEAPSLGTSTVLVVGGGVAVGHGADTAWSGLKQLWTGEEQRSYTAQAATALTGSCLAGDLIDAGVGIVASGGVGVASALSKADKAADVLNAGSKLAGAADDLARYGDDAIEAVGRWGPATGRGPLGALKNGDEVINSFRSGSYTEGVTKESVDLYRVYGGKAGELGPYWTRTPPSGPLQSRIDSALRPEWGNTAQNVTRIRVPPGTTVYEGFAAPQGGGLLGGGSQVYIPRVDPGWVVPK